MQQLLHDLDGIVWVLDVASGAYTYVSKGIRPLLGYAPEDWLEIRTSAPTGYIPRTGRRRRRHGLMRLAGRRLRRDLPAPGGRRTWRSLPDVGHAWTDPDGTVTIRGCS